MFTGGTGDGDLWVEYEISLSGGFVFTTFRQPFRLNYGMLAYMYIPRRHSGLHNNENTERLVIHIKFQK